MRQPNFLFIITDQQRADHLGCYGNPVLRTPHIDALAARGQRFDRCYVATPVCMPNRASIMTGRMPSVHRSRSNGIPLHLGATTFTQVMLKHGYTTGLIGKCHLQNMEDKPSMVPPPHHPGLEATPGLEEAFAPDMLAPAYRQELRASWRNPAHRMSTPYYGFEHVELCNHHADQTFGDWSRWAAERRPDFEQLCGPEHAAPDTRYAAPQCWKTRLPPELYSTSYIMERTLAYLERHAREGGDQPFFLQCSFPDPHHPFTPPGAWRDSYTPEQVGLPPTCGEPGPDAPPHVRWAHDERRSGKAQLTSQRLFAVTPDETRQMIALTYGMIAMIDDAVGRIVAALERLGLAEDTVIVFTSDHGDFMGDHGLMLKGPMHYQGLIRVPLIWSDPRAPEQAGSSSDALASSIDLAPTLLARAGIAPVNGMQGVDLGAARPAARQALLVEEDNQRAYLGFDQPVRVRTLVTADHRLSIYQGADWGEVYDLRADPHERHNLWERDPILRGQLLGQLAQTMMTMGDRSPRPTNVA
ncbi:MAG: sulfatase-like hydrolase/transferase [Ottowia sp.]|nr:sulfatase-like hydrolase/transferase [Ottowia sp.]